MYCNECMSWIEGEYYVFFGGETVLCKRCAEEKIAPSPETTYCDQCGESIAIGENVLTDRRGCVLCSRCVEQMKREE